MEKSKGMKQSEGYSSDNTKPQVKQTSKLKNDSAGPNPTVTLSTTKVAALGKEIDVVRTNNGHYVSRKMIEQLRANSQAGMAHPAPPVSRLAHEVPQSSQLHPNFPSDVPQEYISNRPRPGGLDGPPYQMQSKSGKPGVHQDVYDRPADIQLEDASYNTNSYYNASSSNIPQRSGDFHNPNVRPMLDTPTDHGTFDARNSYDRPNDNPDPYIQNEEYLQDARMNNPTTKPLKKKPTKDRDTAKNPSSNLERPEQKNKEVKRGNKGNTEEQFFSQQVEEFYGPYGVEKNHHAQHARQLRQQTTSKAPITGQEAHQPFYDQYNDQAQPDQYSGHDYDESLYQTSKAAQYKKERPQLLKTDKKPLPPKQALNQMQGERDRRKPEMQGSQAQYANPYQTSNLVKHDTGPSPPQPKGLNVNAPPMAFEPLGIQGPADSKAFGPGGRRDYTMNPSLGGKPSRDSANMQYPAQNFKEEHQPNLLNEISAIVKCIKKYEDNCKELEQIYLQSGLELKNQLNYDFTAFSRNCLNIVRSLLNEVSTKDRSKDKDVLIKKQIEKLKSSIAENQGQIDFLLNLENKNDYVQGGTYPQGPSQLHDVAQISAIIPPSIANTFTMPSLAKVPVPSPIGHTQVPMGTGALYNAPPTAVPPMNTVKQTEIIKKNLQSGAYGSYIMNPYLVQQQSTPANAFSYPNQQTTFENPGAFNQYNYEESYGNLYPTQTQIQQGMFDPMATDAMMPGHIDPYSAQQGLDIQSYGEPQWTSEAQADTVMPISAHQPVEIQRNHNELDTFEADRGFEPNTDPLYPPLGGDFPIYSGLGGGLFGNLSKVNAMASTQKPSGDQGKNQPVPSPQENYKSLFSLFTGQAKSSQTPAKPEENAENLDESSSHGNLQLYSDEEGLGDSEKKSPGDAHQKADPLPRSLEQLLDDDSGGEANTNSKKNVELHPPIEDISDIIPTENRFIPDSQLHVGKEFTLVEENKPNEPLSSPNTLEVRNQFSNNDFNKEDSSQNRKGSQEVKVSSTNVNTTSVKPEESVDPKPTVIIAESHTELTDNQTAPKQRYMKVDKDHSSSLLLKGEGDRASSDNKETIKCDREERIPSEPEEPQIAPKLDSDKDSHGPNAFATINLAKLSIPDSGPTNTPMEVLSIPGVNQTESFGGQNSNHENSNVISSQQVTPVQQPVTSDPIPVCSPSNHVQGDSESQDRASLGQNRDPRVPEDQDLAVPTGDQSYAVAPAGDRNSEKRNLKRGQSLKETPALTEGKGSQAGSSDLKREQPRETMPTTFLNDHQVRRLIDIGHRAANKILDQVSKILDGYADSKSRRKDKRSEDHFFTESENPNGLNIYELCTSSEYSACVQRKLSRLKEAERIELFYLMKPHLIKLLMDGLGKYVVHGMISMSKLS